MKFCVTKEHSFSDIEKFLFPVNQFGEEKRRKGMYDDWDEEAHTIQWLKKVMRFIQSGEAGELTIYYLEEDGTIIASAFTLTGSNLTKDMLEQNGITTACGKVAHFSCFHVLEAFRGKGRGSAWLFREILPDLRNQGVNEVYIKSSHHSALPLYERFGTKIGSYISISDSKLYQRYGYIYKITLS